MKSLRIIGAILAASLISSTAATSRYRVVWQENPHTTAKVIWDQLSGQNPTIHYGKLDHGQKSNLYKNSKPANKHLAYKGMHNQSVRLTNLEPDTNYYFVITDTDSTSKRFFFKTAPAKPHPFKFVQGGDSRNNRNVRQNGNLLVAKIRPLFVSFGGDMIASGNDIQWQAWLDDWQLTIATDGRITPIVPIRGNHESPNQIPKLFALDNYHAYYKLNIGGNHFAQYLLNSEIDTNGDQKNWLTNDLAENNGQVTFLSASYHKPMRPHVSKKVEGNYVYDSWAQIFFNHRFDLLCENDSHCVKRTVPIKPSKAPGNDIGFTPDPEGYTVIGEGGWGAPLRPGSDTKSWTQDSSSFNHFDIITVKLDKLEIRTLNFKGSENASALTELDSPTDLPNGLNFWNPKGGTVKILKARKRTATPQPTIIAFQSEWKYSDGPTYPNKNWITRDFDDSSWKSGKAELGYGDKDETTTLNYGTDKSNKPISYYFRKKFTLKSLKNINALSLNLSYDDGAIVYLNGKEVSRVNLPKGDITPTTLAPTTVINETLANIPIHKNFLVKGHNTLAIAVHNRSKDSSDISFDAELKLVN